MAPAGGAREEWSKELLYPMFKGVCRVDHAAYAGLKKHSIFEFPRCGGPGHEVLTGILLGSVLRRRFRVHKFCCTQQYQIRYNTCLLVGLPLILIALAHAKGLHFR